MRSPAVEAARARKQQLDDEAQRRSAGSYDWLNLGEGVNVIRLLPAPTPDGYFWKEFKVSYKVGPNQRMIVPGHQFGQSDPFHDYLMDLYAQAKNLPEKSQERIELTKKADRMWPQLKFAMWAVERKIGGKDIPIEQQKPKLFSTNANVFRDISSALADPDYDDITDAENGHDLTIDFTPAEKTKDKKNVYVVRPKPKPSPLGTPEQMKEWTKDNLFEKFSIGKPFDAEYVQRILDGTDLTKRDNSTTEEKQEERRKNDAAFFGKSEDNPIATMFWMTHPDTNEVIKTTDIDIAQFVEERGDNSFYVMKQGDKEWLQASDYGFTIAPKAPAPPPPPKKQEASAPPPPKAPEKKPEVKKTEKSEPKPENTPPPVKVEASDDEDEQTLQKQIAELRARKQKGNGVSADLKKAIEE